MLVWVAGFTPPRSFAPTLPLKGRVGRAEAGNFRLSPCGRGYKIEALGERKPPKLQILLVRGLVLRAGRNGRPHLQKSET